jgi:hypothetical protein
LEISLHSLCLLQLLMLCCKLHIRSNLDLQTHIPAGTTQPPTDAINTHCCSSSSTSLVQLHQLLLQRCSLCLGTDHLALQLVTLCHRCTPLVCQRCHAVKQLHLAAVQAGHLALQLAVGSSQARNLRQAAAAEAGTTAGSKQQVCVVSVHTCQCDYD